MHPKVEEFYNKTGLDRLESPADWKDRWFAQATLNQEHKFHISNIYRSSKEGYKSTEKMWWFEEDNSVDHRGNEVQNCYIKGKYEMPIGHYDFDEKSGENRCTGIARLETRYEIDFDPKKLDEFIDKGMIDGRTNFYLESISRTYGDIQFEDFRNMSYDDLLDYCKTGQRPDQKVAPQQAKKKLVAE
jgi:hypothetical protein